MAQAPVRRPQLYSSPGTAFPAVTREAVGDGSNSFVSQQFVVVTTTSGVTTCAKIAAAGTAVYGLSPDGSHATTDEPFNSLYAEKHNPIDPRGQRFIMNLSNGSGTYGTGGLQSSVSVGTAYPGIYIATYDGGNTLAVNTTASGTAAENIFKVVAIYNTDVAPDGDAASDTNGRVIVEVLATAIQ